MTDHCSTYEYLKKRGLSSLRIRQILGREPLYPMRAARAMASQCDVDLGEIGPTSAYATGQSVAPDLLDDRYSLTGNITSQQSDRVRTGRERSRVNPSAYLVELENILLAEKPSNGLNMLAKVGFLKCISQHLQELYCDDISMAIRANASGGMFHGHKLNWPHTMSVLDDIVLNDDIRDAIREHVGTTMKGQDRCIVAERVACEERRALLLLRMAALFHDVAKPRTRAWGKTTCSNCGADTFLRGNGDIFYCHVARCNHRMNLTGLVEQSLTMRRQKGVPVIFDINGMSIDSTISFVGHEYMSASIANVCMAYLGVSDGDASEIAHIIRHHGIRLPMNESGDEITDGGLVRMMNTLSGSTFADTDPGRVNIRRLMALAFRVADTKDRYRAVRQTEAHVFEKRYHEIVAQRTREKMLQDMLVSGNVLQDVFKMRPQRWIGDIHHMLRSAIADGTVTGGKFGQLRLARDMLVNQMIPNGLVGRNLLVENGTDIEIDESQTEEHALKNWIERHYALVKGDEKEE